MTLKSEQSSLDNRPILVTGGTGFTGSHLCQYLLEMGQPVRALVRSNGAAVDQLREWGAEVVVGDLRSADSLKSAVEGVRLVYHIAALFRPENVTRADMFATNAEGTRNMLEAAREANVERFIHCSTVGVHGDIKHPPGTETTPYAPGDAYQDSKVEGEKIALHYMQNTTLPVSIFRPAGIYGPRDMRFLKLFKAIKKRRFIMFGSGKILYQLIYIDDLVEGIVRCGTHPAAVGNVYILTGQRALSLNRLVQTTAEVMNVKPPRLRLPVTPLYLAGWLCELLCKPFKINPPLYRRRVDFFRKTRSFDISKAMEEIGFRPKIPLHVGFGRTAHWYEEQGLL